MKKTPAIILAAALVALSIGHISGAAAVSCNDAAQSVNRHLSDNIDAAELSNVLKTLNATRNTRLPEKFVTKNDAQRLGWRPGKDLWSVAALYGKSIGGDRFGNREGRLPGGNWHEADLDYKGGHRGAKRLVYSSGGLRRVSVDHYQTFIEIPDCQ